MVTNVKGKLKVLNCYPQVDDTDIILADYNKRRRDLFKKGVFEVRDNGYKYELYVNDSFITFWFPGEARVAERAISIAYHTYKAMGGAL